MSQSRSRPQRLARGLGLAAAATAAAVLAAQSQAATSGLQGRWTMVPAQSQFYEAVTGPAPDSASLVVARDDAQALDYQLVEWRGGVVVARAAYALSFKGAPSLSLAEGVKRKVNAAREPGGGVVVQGPKAADARVIIRLRPTGPDTAVLEHELETNGGALELERIALVRSGGSVSN